MLPIKDVLLPRFMGQLYQAIKSKATTPTLILIKIVIVMIIIQGVYIVSDQVDNYLYPALQSYTREIILKKELDNPTDQGDVETGMTLTYMMRLPPLIFTTLSLIKNELIPGLVTLVIITIYLAYLVPICGLLLTLILVIAAIVVITNSPGCLAIYEERDKVHTNIFGQVDDTLNNALLIRASGTQQDEIKRLDANQETYSKLSMQGIRCSQKLKYIVFPLVLLFIMFTCYYCYTTHIQDDKFVTISVVCFILLNTVMMLIGATYKKIIGKWGTMQNSFDALNNTTTSNTTTTSTTTTTAPTPALSTTRGRPGYIDLVDISYSYSASTPPIFSHESFGFKIGKITIVRGQIGKGKSTLLQLLLKIKTPQSGNIFIDGRPYTKEYVYKHMALISQNPKLLNRSIYENIVHGAPNPPPDQHQIDQLISELELTSHIPPINTIVGVSGSKLSGGQKQIISILRAIVFDADIILLDEPTASLDGNSKQVILKILAQTTKDKTVIWVTHEPDIIGDDLITL